MKWMLVAIFALAGLATASFAAGDVLSAKTPDAWVEAKPACVFPLASDALPANVDSLTEALLNGLARLAIPPPQPNRIMVSTANYPALGKLTIDLSNSVEDNDHKPPKVNWH